MKNVIKSGMLIMATTLMTVFATSCSKESDSEPGVSNNANRATVLVFDQEEVFPESCCGEDIMLHYTVRVVLLPNGSFQASLSQLTGVGMTTGNTYHGANTQGDILVGNNETFHFSTTLAGGGCVISTKYIFHITVDSQGNPIVIKDQLTSDCNGN